MKLSNPTLLVVLSAVVIGMTAQILSGQQMMQPQPGISPEMAPMFAEPARPSMSEEFASEVVMIINGEEITMGDLDEVFIGQLVDYIAQSLDPELAALFYDSEAGRQLLKEYTLKNIDDLQTQFVIKQEIKNRNIEITEADKQEYFAQISERLEMMKIQQQLTEEQILQQLGVPSLEALKERVIEEQSWSIKIQKLLEAEVYADLEVTDQQAREFFEENRALLGLPEGLEYEDVQEDIKEHVRMIEGQEHVEKYIADLKAAAEIIMLIP